jgi:adenylate cyclase
MTRRVRLFTGLVLFTYVTMHLLNHALGIVSLRAAEDGRLWFTAFWRDAPLTALLYGSIVTHITLALWALYQRRHMRMPLWEIVRLILGLLIPLMLIPHVFNTRVPATVIHLNDVYARQMLIYWVQNPVGGLQQLTLLTVAWVHGWLGVYHWLRVKSGAAVTLPLLQLLALLVPLLALLGFVEMGREVSLLATDPVWVQYVNPPTSGAGHEDLYARLGMPADTPRLTREVEETKEATWGFFVSCLLLMLAARQVRAIWQRRGGLVRVTYPDGRRVAILPGTTILEASRARGFPHASLCGGRGRCTTCRSRIGAGLEALPPPSADEARVLRRIGAPPNVRLACQTRPTADVDVYPLLPPAPGTPSDLDGHEYAGGTEQEIAILFADMREFTRFSERRLPYDVVFLLNQYSDAMGRAIERAGGYPNQFVGDGIMALFGLDDDVGEGCRAALAAAVSMAQALDTLNANLEHDLREPLRIGIGIHSGHVIVGEMGYGRARYLTAIGDPVNTASRLETLTKEYGCQLVVSETVTTQAGVDLSAFPVYEIQVRGRIRPLQVRVIPSALALESVLQTAGGTRRA